MAQLRILHGYATCRDTSAAARLAATFPARTLGHAQRPRTRRQGEYRRTPGALKKTNSLLPWPYDHVPANRSSSLELC